MRFRVLGPLEVQDASGAVVDVGSPKLRALLALLLLEAGRVVPLDRIVDELWGERPPASATGTVQSYVSNLRRLLEPAHGTAGGDRRPPEVLLTRAPGYLIDVPRAEVDALVLPSLVDEGGRLLAADAPDQARAVLCRALALERGQPLVDLARRRRRRRGAQPAAGPRRPRPRAPGHRRHPARAPGPRRRGARGAGRGAPAARAAVGPAGRGAVGSRPAGRRAGGLPHLRADALRRARHRPGS